MQSTNRWIVRSQGKILGPLTTEQVLNRISKGLFQGNEEIASHPGGEWIPISQAPEFYDKLLDILSKEVRKTIKKKELGSGNEPKEPELKLEAEEAKADEQNDLNHTKKFSKTSSRDESESSHTISHSELRQGKPNSDQSGGEIIELSDLREIVRRDKRRRRRGPAVLLVLAILGLVVAYLFLWDTNKPSRTELRAPNNYNNPIDPQSFTKKMATAIGFIEMDDYHNYIRAEDLLIDLVEHSPTDTAQIAYRSKALSNLCLVYRELWPYTAQTPKDKQVVVKVFQLAMKSDPVGPFGTSCYSTYYLLEGHVNEVTTIINTFLNTVNELSPEIALLYEIKSEVAGISRDYVSAIDHLQKARKIWDRWIKIYVREAEFQDLAKQPANAVALYETVTRTNPNHAIARIKWGTLEEKQYRHYDRALALLDSGLNGTVVPSHVAAEGYYSLARIFHKQGEREKAVQNALKCVTLVGSNLECRRLASELGGVNALKPLKAMDGVYVGDQFFKSGEYLAAQAEYKAAFEVNPKDGVAAMKAAQCLWLLNQGSDAIDWLRKAVVADPELTEAYVKLADYYSQRFNYGAAIKALAQATRQKSTQYLILGGYALVEYRRNNLKGAIRYGLEALKHYGADIETNVLIAKAYLKDGDFNEAYKFAAKAVELNPSHEQAQITLAEVLAGIKGIDSGLYHLTLLIQNQPYNVSYRLATGDLYFQSARYAEAEEVYRQVVEIEKNNKKAFLKLGQSLHEQNKLVEAFDAYLKAATLDPSDAEALFLVGQYYLEKKQPSEAIKQFQRVIRVNEFYPLTHYLIGRAFLQKGDLQGALNEAHKESMNNPNLADPYLLAAEAYTKAGDYAKCATEIQKAIKVRSSSADIYVKLGQCYRLSGQHDAALAVLRVGEGKESGNPNIYRELGLIFEARGNMEEAIVALRKYLQLNPNGNDKNEIERKINEIERAN